MSKDINIPISTDQPLPAKELDPQKQMTGKARVQKEQKKKNVYYYFVLGIVMIVLVFFGIFFGFYLRNSDQDQPITVPTPTPVEIKETPVASSATTIEVIKEKMGILDDKLEKINLQKKELTPPLLDFKLEEILKDIEIDD